MFKWCFCGTNKLFCKQLIGGNLVVISHLKAKSHDKISISGNAFDEKIYKVSPGVLSMPPRRVATCGRYLPPLQQMTLYKYGKYQTFTYFEWIFGASAIFLSNELQNRLSSESTSFTIRWWCQVGLRFFCKFLKILAKSAKYWIPKTIPLIFVWLLLF